MISSGLSADLNSRVIPARGRPSPLGAATTGPGRARRILTPTTGHETRTRAKTGERREARVRFSLVKPPVGRGANQKPEEPLCNTRLATPLLSCLRFFLFSPSRVHCHPPRWTVVPRGGSRPPFRLFSFLFFFFFFFSFVFFFSCPGATARAGALCRSEQSTIVGFHPGLSLDRVLETRVFDLAPTWKTLGRELGKMYPQSLGSFVPF